MPFRPLKALTWNLFHGRSVPPAERPLLEQFKRLIASWDWDVALLQEVPPWWPPLLAEAAGAEWRMALTSRNACLPLRKEIAKRWPDRMKSNGGGCNVILARREIVEHRQVRLRVWPERRVAQMLRLAGELSVVNFHASTRRTLAREELARLAEIASAWAGKGALVFGGDLNLRDPQLPFERVAASTVDFLFVHGLRPAGPQAFLNRAFTAQGRQLQLSDHRPLSVALERASAGT